MLNFFRYRAAYPQCVSDRFNLDRRRLESAHMQFALLKVARWYEMDLNAISLHSDTTETMGAVIENYHGLFMAHYSSKFNVLYIHDIYNYHHFSLTNSKPLQ